MRNLGRRKREPQADSRQTIDRGPWVKKQLEKRTKESGKKEQITKQETETAHQLERTGETNCITERSG